MRNILSCADCTEIGTYIRNNENKNLDELWDYFANIKNPYKGLTKELLKRIYDGSFMSSFTGIKRKAVNVNLQATAKSDVVNVKHQPANTAIDENNVMPNVTPSKVTIDTFIKSNNNNRNITYPPEVIEGLCIALIYNKTEIDSKEMLDHYEKIFHYYVEAKSMPHVNRQHTKDFIKRFLTMQGKYNQWVSKYFYKKEDGIILINEDYKKHEERFGKAHPELYKLATQVVTGITPKVSPAPTPAPTPVPVDNNKVIDNTNKPTIESNNNADNNLDKPIFDQLIVESSVLPIAIASNTIGISTTKVDNTNAVNNDNDVTRELLSLDELTVEELINKATENVIASMSLMDIINTFSIAPENTSISELNGIIQKDVSTKTIKELKSLIINAEKRIK